MNQEKLIEEVCRATGRSIRTPQDFEFLRRCIYEKTRETLGLSTLERVLGYVRQDVKPSRMTLNILSRYVGYRDYEHFCNSSEDASSQSNVVVHDALRAETLGVGARLRLTWQPGRVCVVRYLGGNRFVVEEAENTKLSVGDTFSAMLFICHEPLHLTNLVHEENFPVSYVIGSKDGIMFEK